MQREVTVTHSILLPGNIRTRHDVLKTISETAADDTGIQASRLLEMLSAIYLNYLNLLYIIYISQLNSI